MTDNEIKRELAKQEHMIAVLLGYLEGRKIITSANEYWNILTITQGAADYDELIDKRVAEKEKQGT